MEIGGVKGIFRELSESVLLLAMTTLSLGGYLGLALILVKAAR